MADQWGGYVFDNNGTFSGMAGNSVDTFFNTPTSNQRAPATAQWTAEAGSAANPTGSLSGNTGGNTYSAPDPYAQWGGQGNFNQLVSGFNTQKDNIYGTSRDAAGNALISRKSSILDFLDSLKLGQRNINERAIQALMAKKQGFNSIMSMVGQGLKSGGVILDNKNAQDSSAAEQMAKAYGQIGGRENNKVNNQFAQENHQIDLAQDEQELQRRQGLRKFGESKLQSVNSIVSEARNSLAQLDAAMLDADMPTRISIEGEKNKIKAEVMRTLSKYDSMLSTEAGKVRPSSVDDRRATAFQRVNEGVSATNPFDFSTEAPSQFQGTGPFSSEIPLFNLRNRRESA